MRVFVSKCLLIIGSLVVSLVAAECAVRVFVPQSRHEYSVAPTGNQYDFYQFDPVLGWSNAARVAVLGDSFVWGHRRGRRRPLYGYR